jgi:hypothetical protein
VCIYIYDFVCIYVDRNLLSDYQVKTLHKLGALFENMELLIV